MHGRHDALPLGVNRERGGDRVAAGVVVGGGVHSELRMGSSVEGKTLQHQSKWG